MPRTCKRSKRSTSPVNPDVIQATIAQLTRLLSEILRLYLSACQLVSTGTKVTMARRLNEAIHPAPQTQMTGKSLTAAPHTVITASNAAACHTRSRLSHCQQCSRPSHCQQCHHPSHCQQCSHPSHCQQRSHHLHRPDRWTWSYFLTNLFVMPPPVRQYLQPSHLL